MLIKCHALSFSLEGYSGVVEPSECIHISAMSKIVLKVNYLGTILVLTLLQQGSYLLSDLFPSKPSIVFSALKPFYNLRSVYLHPL